MLFRSNVIADALSRKNQGKMSSIMLEKWKAIQTLESYGGFEKSEGMLVSLEVQPVLLTEVKNAQRGDPEVQKLKEGIENGTVEPEWSTTDEGTLTYRGRYFVIKDKELRKKVLAEAHHSKLTIHPGNTKMYHDLKRQYYWKGMKRDVAEFIAHCLTCQQVKVEH